MTIGQNIGQPVALERLDVIVHPGFALPYIGPEAEKQVLDAIVRRTGDLVGSHLALVLSHLDLDVLRMLGDANVDNPRRMIHDAVVELLTKHDQKIMLVHASGLDVALRKLEPLLHDVREHVLGMGLLMDANMQVTLRGEMADICVARTANQMSGAFGLRHPPFIDLAATDALTKPDEWKEGGALLARARQNNPNLRFIPVGSEE
jgi:hypothetical protein